MDLDCAEAITLAPHFLPETGMICGRPAALNSHCFYIVSEMKTKKFNDPGADNQNATMVEIRANGATVVPPSQTLVDKHGNDDGEREERAWTGNDLNPATISNQNLLRSVSALAASVLLARAWNSGQRHEIGLALSGTLAHGSIPQEQAIQIVKGICIVTRDTELDDRIQSVHTTYAKLAEGDNVTGMPTLIDLIGDKRVQKIADWLGFSVTPDIAEQAEDKWMPAVLSEWITDAPPETEWILDGLMPRGIACGIGGTGGLGKSYLLLELRDCTEIKLSSAYHL